MKMPDVSTPIVNVGKDREEIFLVYFDGFIKNPCEGIVRTMLRDDDIWMERYPFLESFEDFDADEMYDNTLLFRPIELLDVLGEHKVSKEQIEKDLNIIRPDIILDNSKITAFEFSLYQLLHENFLKKCYIFKEEPFFDNEIAYVRRQFKEVIGKIEFATGGFLTLFEEVNPTTICTTNKDIVLNYMATDEYPDEKLEEKLFIFNNDLSNVFHIDDSNTFDYKEEFRERINNINKNEVFVISTMYNIALNTDSYDDFIQHDGIIPADEELEE